MAGRVYHQEVTIFVASPICPSDHMMDMPPTFRCDQLMADCALSLLVYPQIIELPSTFQGILHFVAYTSLKVRFPLRVERMASILMALCLTIRVSEASRRDFSSFFPLAPRSLVSTANIQLRV